MDKPQDQTLKNVTVHKQILQHPFTTSPNFQIPHSRVGSHLTQGMCKFPFSCGSCECWGFRCSLTPPYNPLVPVRKPPTRPHTYVPRTRLLGGVLWGRSSLWRGLRSRCHRENCSQGQAQLLSYQLRIMLAVLVWWICKAVSCFLICWHFFQLVNKCLHVVVLQGQFNGESLTGKSSLG